MSESKISINQNNLNKNVSPKEDFFEYANGGWIKNNPIPEDQSRWGSFYEINEMVRVQLQDLISGLKNDKNIENNTDAQKIRDYYNSYMDEEQIEKLRESPLAPYRQLILNLDRREDLPKLLAKLHRLGVRGFFHFTVVQDEKNSSMDIATLYQGGLGMPDRDYYLNNDEKTQDIQMSYKKFISNLHSLFNESEPNIKMESIYALEKRLAQNSFTKVELRDPEKNYNKYSIGEFIKECPNFDWVLYFKELTGKEIKHLVVGQVEFIKEVDRILVELSLQEIKQYLQMCLMSSYSGALSKDFVNESFDFYGKKLSGSKEIKPRWKRAISSVDNTLGFPLGKLYVERYFSESAKKKIYELVGNVMEIMKERIDELDWMSDETKKQALKKLSTFVCKLGYPDVWRDYSKLRIVSTSLFDNMVASQEFEFDYMVSKIDMPVNRNEWELTPHTINAYYQPPMNEIVFPAGILQPPFFHEDSEDALNYAGIGSVIAHEITHGFDDQGGKYDHEGNLKEWWTEDDRNKFNEKAKVLVDQFNSIFPFPDLHINGELTLGENIADLGGMLLAYKAYIKSLNGKDTPPVIDGLNHTQRFFLRFAESECVVAREESVRQQILIDPHSPSKYRVNQILKNIDAFYDAFDIKENDPMYLAPEKRARIW